MRLIDFFGLTKFAKITHGFSLVWLLVLIVFVPFWSNQLQNDEQNLGRNVYYWYLFTLMQNL